jgi:hypothetical protein
MKRSLLILSVFLPGLFLTGGVLHAQPEFKSDVHKEYDEHGNLERYDSCWSWSYHDPIFRGVDSVYSGHTYPDFESFFGDRTFPDFDSLFEHHQFPDLESFFQDHPFPDFEELFEGHPFPDFEEFFEGHPFPDFDELFEHFHYDRFHEDSIPQNKPGWQSLPGNNKKSPRAIEI